MPLRLASPLVERINKKTTVCRALGEQSPGRSVGTAQWCFQRDTPLVRSGRARVLVVLLIVCAGVAGCTSPEAGRTRGGGPGADVGNRTETVKMHEGSEPFWKTPDLIVGEHPPLEPARQAEQLSRQ